MRDGSSAAEVYEFPPTPEELQRAELVVRLLSLVQQSTANIMALVGEHAFGGFPRAEAEELSKRIAEAAELCHRCEHSMMMCNLQAVKAATAGEDRDLLREVRDATSHFDLVASAARSVLEQTPRPSLSHPDHRHPMPLYHQQSEEVASAWSDLFGLEAEVNSATAHTASTPRRAADGRREAAQPEAPPSAALELWRGRSTTVQPAASSSSAFLDPPPAANAEGRAPLAACPNGLVSTSSTIGRVEQGSAHGAAPGTSSMAASLAAAEAPVEDEVAACDGQWRACVMEPAATAQDAIDINAALIEQKKGQMEAVAAEVRALNELFAELGHFVAVQGAEVRNAAALAHKVHDDVAAAKQELEQAEKEQGCVVS